MRFTSLFSAFPRLAAAALCVVGGAGALQALVLQPQVSDPAEGIGAFISHKLKQPVVRADEQWTLLAAGDIMLSRYVRAILEREGADYPYAEIRGIASRADVAFANLENPVGTGTPIPFSGFRFRAEPETLGGLKEAGFDVLSIANNHMSDNGRAGVALTAQFLKEAGFAFAGAGENEAAARAPAVLDVQGQTVGFLAYGESRFANQVHFAGEKLAGIALADPVHMKEDVAQARRTGAEVVIISLHAGTEYRETPDSYQRSLLDAAADAGADIVLGHHPHVIQPLEKRGESWIISSLGNLVFDQMWGEHVRRGMMLQFRFAGTDVREIEAIPIQIHDYAQARVADGEPRDLALESLAHPLLEATVIRWLGAGSGATVTPRAMPLRADMLPGFSLEKTVRDNLNGNRRGERYVLKDGLLTVEEDDFPLWESPSDWWVQNAFTADLDGDRRRELVLSVWRAGGTASFTRTGGDRAIRNFLHVFGFRDGLLTELRRSEALELPHCETMAADLDADGRDELVTLDGVYRPDASCEGTAVTVWVWNGGKLSIAWKSDAGRYWDLRAEGSGSGERIVVNGAAD